MIDRSGYGRGRNFRSARDFTDIHGNCSALITAENLNSIIGMRLTLAHARFCSKRLLVNLGRCRKGLMQRRLIGSLKMQTCLEILTCHSLRQ
jgi:hypothetical protein